MMPDKYSPLFGLQGMYRERILNTKTKHPAALRLKDTMLEYHDFQLSHKHYNLHTELARLSQWQSERLQFSHRDFYQSAHYQKGLFFLFNELYSDADFTQRDQDLERIFPKMVKLLPESIIETVSLLVELNMLTQMLDTELCTKLFIDLKHKAIHEQSYCDAFRQCQNQEKRAYQIELTQALGKKLDQYARSQIILYSLKLSKNPAESAGLGALHQFLSSGFTAFHSMKHIDKLMSTIAERETHFLREIMLGNTQPFGFKIET